MSKFYFNGKTIRFHLQVQKFKLHLISIIGSGNRSFRKTLCLFVCLFVFYQCDECKEMCPTFPGNLTRENSWIVSILIFMWAHFWTIACSTNMLPEFYLFILFIFTLSFLVSGTSKNLLTFLQSLFPR